MDEKKAKRKRRLKIFGRIMLAIAGVIVIALIICHKLIIDTARSYIGYTTISNPVKESELREITLTKEQMLEDFEFYYSASVRKNLTTELAEQYFDVDYDEIYETYKARIENSRDEYEFICHMIALGGKVPGGHSVVSAPAPVLTRPFPGAEFADKETKIVNASLTKKIEARMSEFDQKGIVAIYYDGEYMLYGYSSADFEVMDELNYAKLLTLNGKPVKDVVKDIDGLHHWKYDTAEESVYLSEFTLNDGVGVKYTAEIELEDGTVITKDLYNSIEYSVAFYYRSMLYPETHAKEGGSSSGVKKSYRIETVPERKLLYASFDRCDSSEQSEVRQELNKALESADIDTVILDFRSNSGGEYSYVTEGVLPPVLDRDAGHINTEVFLRDGYAGFFLNSGFYKMIRKFKKDGDKVRAFEDFTVKGMASKHYDIYGFVNHGTFSSGDIFAYIAKDAGITLIGQNTGGDGLSGNPLCAYLPNSKLQFTFVSSMSERYPEDGIKGVDPDYFAVQNVDTMRLRRELFPGAERDVYGQFENRVQWDPYVQKALELMEQVNK